MTTTAAVATPATLNAAKRILAARDLDKDQALTAAELGAAHAKLDQDKNGFVDLMELTTGLQRLDAASRAAAERALGAEGTPVAQKIANWAAGLLGAGAGAALVVRLIGDLASGLTMVFGGVAGGAAGLAGAVFKPLALAGGIAAAGAGTLALWRHHQETKAMQAALAALAR